MTSKRYSTDEGADNAPGAGSQQVRRLLAGFAVACSFVIAACGPEGRSIGDSCPDLPLYRFVYSAKTDTWTRIHLSASDAGEPVTGSAADDIAKAEGHCITAAGNSETIEPGSSSSGTGGSSKGGAGGAGGSSSTGAGGASRDAGVD